VCVSLAACKYVREDLSIVFEWILKDLCICVSVCVREIAIVSAFVRVRMVFVYA